MGNQFKVTAEGRQRSTVYAYKIDYVNYQPWITVENPNLPVIAFPKAMAEL
jgi:hypothetical protein